MKKILVIFLLSLSTMFGFEELSSFNFKEKVKNGNVIVDFYAPWCPPCKVLAKSLEEFNKVKSDDIKIYKINIDDYKQLAIKEGVKMLPTLIFYKNGEKVTREVGVKDVSQLVNISKMYFY